MPRKKQFGKRVQIRARVVAGLALRVRVAATAAGVPLNAWVSIALEKACEVDERQRASVGSTVRREAPRKLV